MTVTPAVQTIPSPYCFCTTHDSTGWRMGAIAGVRMPMGIGCPNRRPPAWVIAADGGLRWRSHSDGRKERKKPEGEYLPAFLPDCHAFTFLLPGNGTSTKSSTLMLSGSTMM